MLKIAILISVLLSIGVMAADSNVKEIMEADDVVPDTVDVAPSEEAEVIYSGDLEVEVGGELTPAQVRSQPQVIWDADPEKYYVVSMVDPDAPSRANPTLREIEHWLVVNVKGGDISTGEVLASYIGSGPPQGSGLHRYIIFVFEQKEKQIFDEPTTVVNRANFSIRKFAEKYDLGDPIAGNFFHAQYQEA